jgi:uncharacterized protein YndB with AHSA1/START domain
MTTTRAAIECDEFLPFPAETVWHAITTPDLVERWWAAGDIQPVVGHAFTLDMGPWGRQQCTVLVADAPRLLRYTFSEGGLDSTLTFRLEPEGAGTRLFFTHDGLDLDDPRGRQAYEGMGRGWPGVIHRIGGVIAEANSAG